MCSLSRTKRLLIVCCMPMLLNVGVVHCFAGTSYTFSALPYKSYSVTVVALISFLGQSYVSASISNQTVVTSQAPATAVSITSATPLNSSISLSWTQPSNPNGLITNYNISWNVTTGCSSSTDCSSQVTASNGTSAVISPLTSCRNYWIQIYATNGAGAGAVATTNSYTLPNSKFELLYFIIC